MEIEGLLLGIAEKLIDIESGMDLLSVYMGEENLPKGKTILTLLYNGKLDATSATKMIEKILGTQVEVEESTSKVKESKKRKERRAARPLEWDEYVKIINLCKNGFSYMDNLGESHEFRPNKQLAMTFMLQSNLGLRISDVMKLKPATFKNDKLEVVEKKTGKLQYRTINKNLKDLIYEYALENNIKSDEYLIKVKVRAIQKQLDIIVKYLGLTHVSSHSFRKLFGVTVYNQTNGNIELLKELFNHTDISTTQRYIRVSQKEIDSVSSSIDFTEVWE
ncbi:MAG: tyrosine-type recombinase/integrase [Clostridium sp.]